MIRLRVPLFLGLTACTSFGSTSNTAPPADAGPSTIAEAGAPEGGSPAASCDAGVVFCDGFERSASDVLGGWTQLHTHDGTATIDAVHAHGSGAFHSSIPAAPAPSSGPELVIDEPVGTTLQSVDFKFSFFAPSTSRHVNMGQLDLGGDDLSLIIIGFDDGKLFVGRQSNSNDDVVIKSYVDLRRTIYTMMPSNQWNDVELTIAMQPNPTIVVKINGESAALTTNELNAVSGVTTKVRAGFGTTYSDPGDTTDVWFDDVSLTLTE